MFLATNAAITLKSIYECTCSRNNFLSIYVTRVDDFSFDMVMMINELNTGLIEALKEKLPPKTNLANLLMDTLCIGREAIYRRLRGEVPFTLEEAALISRKLGVSLDKIVGVSFSANAVFDLNVVDHDDPFNAYFTILSRYVKIFRAFQDDPTTALGTSFQYYSSDPLFEA